jgi:ribosomal protein S21
MRKKKNFRRRPKKELQGLQVEVYDGQVEKAMRTLKRKVKDSNLFLDLRKKVYYEKPSKLYIYIHRNLIHRLPFYGV